MIGGKADVARRVIAAGLDMVVAMTLSALLSPLQPLGRLLGAAYLTFRDVLPFALTKAEGWRRRSIGKRLVNLEVVTLDGDELTWVTSLKRNFPFAIGLVAEVLPTILAFLLVLVAPALLLLELIFIFADAKGRRLGDQWANTQVVSQD